eukprot:Tbor_TRINITY_DN5500_c6_g8::TRINITY_DN5500_c6_g8_i1::g.12858::m.12858/K02876/RP-L15, MRPL15, rplO; large subunit ribosomal protein L15
MLSKTCISLRYVTFDKPSNFLPLNNMPVKSIFPLIYSNNLLNKTRKTTSDYKGREAFDDDHVLPVQDTHSLAYATPPGLTEYDLRINPQLIQRPRDLCRNPDYVGSRAGHFFPQTGWKPMGTNWKECKSYKFLKKGLIRAEWQERHVTPRFMAAPRVSPSGARSRFEGKLQYSIISLRRIMWAIEAGEINPNEVITLRTLQERRLVGRRSLVWPGYRLITGGCKSVPYPLRIELQRATQGSIKALEDAGGSFVAAFLSPEGIEQELQPELYPTFIDQPFPDRMGMERVYGSRRERGYLSGWVSEEAKYAHPDSGRRLAHYVKPPADRDFPATFEEYERVKHHQKWHLNQPGTGTVLPWHYLSTHDLVRTQSGTLQ